ncbi:TPA: adenylate kinase [Candidatus Scatousia excrementigallinarum]|uniref:Adenylate kinase n=1 Tax=Candidatus Scatousia excrementigallinarum TaxID=2840935 RepID=A0A9D1JNU0_9BACT|nr:adenylate kinase [Candidatus Scatousia excrementigallinarum]
MTKKELIFLGPPACGKGTQTEKLAKYLNFPHVDTGSLLRAEIKNETPDGKIAKSFIDKGNLVPADLVAKIIKNRLSQEDCKKGFILDGYPRSVEQADKLEIIQDEINNGDEVDFRAIYFDIDTDILVERIVNRRSCPVCGEIYNLEFKPPKVAGHCDNDGAELTQRKDDTREVAQARFETYFHETAPLIDYYKKKGVLKTIDANGTIEEVWERLLKVVND